MVEFKASLPAKWAEYLKRLADNHEINLNNVMNELCEWAFSGLERKEQFEDWLDEAYPPKGEAEDKANAAGEETSENEEEADDEAEEESHAHRD
jgi:hypothetical protein